MFLLALLAAGNAFGQNCYLASVPEIDGKLEYCIRLVDERYEVKLLLTRESADSFIVIDKPATYILRDTIAYTHNEFDNYLHESLRLYYVQKMWTATYYFQNGIASNHLALYFILDRNTVGLFKEADMDYAGYKDLASLPNTIFMIEYHIHTKTFDFKVVNSEFLFR